MRHDAAIKLAYYAQGETQMRYALDQCRAAGVPIRREVHIGPTPCTIDHIRTPAGYEHHVYWTTNGPIWMPASTAAIAAAHQTQGRQN